MEKLKTNVWYSSSTMEFPPLNSGSKETGDEYIKESWSVRVVVKIENEPIKRFARYSYDYKKWIIEGLSGNFKVVAWINPIF